MPMHVNGKLIMPKYCYHPYDPEASHPDSVTSSGGFSCMTFGLDEVAIVSVNTTDENHALINAKADTLRFPLNMGNTISQGAIDTAGPFLESIGFPCDWITPALTYKQVVRRLVKFCQIGQEFQGMFKRKMFESLESLNTPLSELTANKRNRLRAIYDRKNIDHPSSTDTLRDVLNTLTLNYRNPDGNRLGVVHIGDTVL